MKWEIEETALYHRWSFQSLRQEQDILIFAIEAWLDNAPYFKEIARVAEWHTQGT